MQVYRITLSKWSSELVASGNPARWNSKGKFVLYTAATRALACLENVVHRSGEGLDSRFHVMVISIPNTLKISKLLSGDLPDNWKDYSSYSDCQALGDNWYEQERTAVLKVPSAIIPEECNYLLNTKHPDFSKIDLMQTEEFFFDQRLK